MRPKTEDEVRLALQREVGEAVPDGIWLLLVEERYVQEVLDGYENAFPELVKRYRLLSQIQRRGTENRSPKKQRKERTSPPDRRTLLLARLRAQMAGDLPLVRRFRRQHLGGNLLTPEEVCPWIERRAQEDGPPTRLAEVLLPAGVSPEYDPQTRTYRIGPLPEGLPVVRGRWEMLDYISPDRPDETQSIPVAAGGVLDALREVSEWLAGEFGWTRAQATTFVLTGQTPVISPLSISTRISWGSVITARIVIHADPEVSPETVKQKYQEVRKEVRGGGRRYHPLAKWVIDLVEFVQDTPTLTWSERLEKWNRDHPDHRYSVSQAMSNAYYRGMKKLSPDYSLP